MSDSFKKWWEGDTEYLKRLGLRVKDIAEAAYLAGQASAEQRVKVAEESLERCRTIANATAECWRADTENIDGLKAELAELSKEARSMRQALIGWRQRAWPGTDQTKVIDRDFPAIAAMEAQTNERF